MRRLAWKLAPLFVLVGLSTAATSTNERTVYSGALNHSGRATLDLTLYAGYEYSYVGACDRDCTDLDFILYRWGSNGWREVDRDLLPDDVPEVGVTPSRTGVYRLVIIMETCWENPCGYQVDVS